MLAPASLWSGATAQLFGFFAKTGCLVFGSGLVIVPILRPAVVDGYGWLTEQQFIDAVAIGLVSPGPVVITATFVGYAVDGLRGALAATVGMFTPAVLFTLIVAPLFQRHGTHRRVRGFVRGITAAVVGALAGSVPLVATTALPDASTVVIVAASLILLARRWPDPLVVLLAAASGLALGAR
jgi:chromate transporter